MVKNRGETKVHIGWLVGLASALLFFYGFMLGGQQLVMIDIAEEYHVNTQGMGLLVSAQHVAAVLMPLCMGVVADRIGKKKVLVAFTLVFGMGCALSGLSNSILMYLFGACLIGSGYSVCESLSSAVMTDLDPEQGMRYINITQLLLSIGAILSPVILRFCMSRLHARWRLGFMICSFAFLILAVFLGKACFPQKREKVEAASEKAIAISGAQMGMILCFFLSIILYVGLENGFGYFVNPLFSIQLEREELGAMAISGYWAGMSASRFLCGLRNYHPGRMLLTCFSLSGVLFLFLVFMKVPWFSIAVCFFLGFAFGPIWSTLVASAAEVCPEKSAGVIGLMSTGCGLGGILYPTLMGFLSEKYNLQTAFFCLAVTSFAGFLLCLAAAVKKKK